MSEVICWISCWQDWTKMPGLFSVVCHLMSPFTGKFSSRKTIRRHFCIQYVSEGVLLSDFVLNYVFRYRYAQGTSTLYQSHWSACQDARIHCVWFERILFSHLCSCFFYSLDSFDYAEDFPVALEEMRGDLISGKLKRHFHKIEGGIEEAPKALPMLFSGENVGKLCVDWELDSAGKTDFFILQSGQSFRGPGC